MMATPPSSPLPNQEHQPSPSPPPNPNPNSSPMATPLPRKSHRNCLSPPPPASSTPASHPSAGSRKWAEDETLALLRAVLGYHYHHGPAANPIHAVNLPSFFSSVEPLLHKPISKDQVAYKVRSLERRFKSGPRPTTPFEAQIDQLSRQIWGSDRRLKVKAELLENGDVRKELGKELMEVDGDEDGGDVRTLCPLLVSELESYWEEKGYCRESLDEALEMIDLVSAKVLEQKWVAHNENGFRLRAKQAALDREFWELLAMASKGT